MLRFYCIFLLLGCLVPGIVTTGYAQVRRDSVRVSPRANGLDSLRRDTSQAQGAQMDSARRGREIETSVKYNARDSIVLDVDGKIARLYGDANIDYGDIAVSAAYIEINWDTGIVDATGVKDTAGRVIGSPVFTDGGQKYETERIRYNITSKKAVIGGVITTQGEGFMQGDRVFKDPYDNLYVRGAIYTTCNLKKPHFHIFARKIKVVGNRQIVSGPFNFYLNNIPLPVGLPFGFFPYSQTRKSGIIVPTYGEEPQNRGFFLRQGGYYWAMSEYADMSFLGEIFSRGGWGLNVRSNYARKYRYNGNVDVRFNRQSIGDEGFKSITDAFWISWAHSPFSRGTGRFSASVNAGTTNFNSRFVVPVQGIQSDISRRISPTFNSNISYSNAVRGLPITYSMNLRHDMNTTTGIMNLSLPEFNVSLNRIYPLKGKSGGGRYFWQTLNFNYQVDGFNRLTNSVSREATSIQALPILNASTTAGDTLEFNLANAGALWQRAERGMRHTIPVSMTMKLLKYFSLNYNFNYSETWYPRKLSFFDARGQFIAPSLGGFRQGDGIRVDTSRGFNRSYQYSTGVNLTTNVYGTYFIRGKRVEAIRHRLVPSVGLNYQPDFARNSFGFYQTVVVQDSSGRFTSVPLARFQASNGLPGTGRSGNISFSLSNTLEAKLRAKSDTAKKQFEKVSILDNLGISTSYNLAADSFNLAPVSISARTRLFKKVDVNFSSTLDPYKTIEYFALDSSGKQRIGFDGQPTLIQRRASQYAWSRETRFAEGGNISRVSGVNLGQLTNLNLSISTSLNPKANKKTAEKVDKSKDATEDQKQAIKANPNLYVDFDIPWDLNVAYNFNYIKNGFQTSRVIQTLTFNGEVKITDKWRVGFNSGYDFERKSIVNTTQFNIFRDLHCWDMAVTWSPFGQFQFYSFDLKVKASILQDLKLSRRGGPARSGVF